jgi:hypothetical protein
MPLPIDVRENLDADEGLFFERELEFVKQQTYDIKYTELKATRMIPVSTAAGPGAESIVYEQYDSVGIMKIIADYADDLPRSDVKGKEFITPVKSLGGGYGYSLQEIRASMKAGKRLETRKANAARKSYDQRVNNIAWKADGSAAYGGLTGFFYNANTTKSPAPTGTWSTATPDQIIADVNFAINNIKTVTKGVESANVVMMPVEQMALISSTPRSSTSDTTILEFLRRVHPGVTFEELVECDAVDPAPSGGAAPTDLLIAYRRDPNNLTLELPQLFEQLPVQRRNLEFVVNTHARIAGVIMYYPLSVHIVEGI